LRQDLHQQVYNSKEEYQEYIYGSADVVGLMCLKVFVNGDNNKYNELRDGAMRLGSAFQKVNFLRDLKADFEELNRTYFPNTNLTHLDEKAKKEIIADIDADFDAAYLAIKRLPVEARFGVYTAYRYYKRLLKKLKATPSTEIKNVRIRVPDYQKLELLARCYVKYRLNLL
jgi:phytoene/squalene synthetase